MGLSDYDGRFPEPPYQTTEEINFDIEAVAWAYSKLKAYGCENSSQDNAMMMDRLHAMLDALGVA